MISVIDLIFTLKASFICNFLWKHWPVHHRASLITLDQPSERIASEAYENSRLSCQGVLSRRNVSRVIVGQRYSVRHWPGLAGAINLSSGVQDTVSWRCPRRVMIRGAHDNPPPLSVRVLRMSFVLVRSRNVSVDTRKFRGHRGHLARMPTNVSEDRGVLIEIRPPLTTHLVSAFPF